MIEKIGPIKNPLTIIAVFAAISEISGTIVLPLIAPEHQSKFIWFVMLFPAMLVCLFFATLNWNHKVLYAPSDFDDENNFFRGFQEGKPSDRAQKLKDEIEEMEATEDSPTQESDEAQAPPPQQPPKAPSTSPDADNIYHMVATGPGRYFLAEELVLSKLSKEFGQPVKRNINIAGSRDFLFDGLIVDNKQANLIEVKYMKDARNIAPRLKLTIDRMIRAYIDFPKNAQDNTKLIIAIATDSEEYEFPKAKDRALQMLSSIPFPIELRIFNLPALEKEFKIS